TVFLFLFTVEVYTRSRSFSYIDDDGSGCTNNKDRYMRINMAKCENKNSRRECSAMANGDTRSNRNTHFRLVKRGKKSCITFNNTYSLMVQGNKVSFVNVSCHSKDNVNKVVWFNYEVQDIKSKKARYRVFYYKQGGSFMCLTRDCTGTLNVTRVNSPLNRNCSFSTYNNL
ncbi:unnamed protein product, partial [Porites lobata]